MLGLDEGQEKRSHWDVASFATRLHRKCAFLITRISALWCDAVSEEGVRLCSNGPAVKKLGNVGLTEKLALWL